ncbi:hypothetical protein [Azospirillum sp.]|uniref:hypothetical protein n=1 Tax=Azospirillum sp. TaxID=34012 RepID=UPI002D35B668|nr:hypothetical protein [Azospirillum sp.]HYD69912.1 hypothetical protein [Azospirillum sp.]
MRPLAVMISAVLAGTLLQLDMGVAFAQTAVFKNQQSSPCNIRVVRVHSGVSNFTVDPGKSQTEKVGNGDQWCYSYDSGGITDCKGNVASGMASGCFPVIMEAHGANSCSPQNDLVRNSAMCTN